MNEFVQVFRKWNVFSGRARRREYWMFTLFYFVFGIVFGILDVVFGTVGESSASVGLFYGVYSLVMLFPSLAVLCRRLHDAGYNNWWLLISLVPLIGQLVLLIFTLQDSQPGSNKWGPNPKLLYPNSAFIH
ncbi:DUF805 domain-containing protein [Deinococcus irradiatisoli]|uniref:DUF805 domain-containing protein n=1 Tax=Deinococcus irradiatisoli TaxID=2202254 RepID=A0A2Z3JHI9_9DEIO|nr:DUF805 domain-containing protein [Deinococcus irradiatisoli]AWN23516.1 DUF805 domain-containing protein [Deinococcus irradiatisoli]